MQVKRVSFGLGATVPSGGLPLFLSNRVWRRRPVKGASG
jgi:hypothetical protein